MRKTSLVLLLGWWSLAIAEPLPTAPGYHGIWYANQKSGDEFRYKYSGGMATYPQQHHPIAWHVPSERKTFFCYGGAKPGSRNLLHMVAYFDHATGMVPRPRILLDKRTTDAHDNPTLVIDDAGHLWIFSNSHGTARPAYIHRSVRPYDIDEFERIDETNFSYSQPWNLSAKGFLFLHTRYSKGQRRLHWQSSVDGRQWTEPRVLAAIDKGHYQVSWRHEGKVGTAFNYHPSPVGLNARTNLYYLESPDLGRSWRSVDGTVVDTPLGEPANPALVHDYRSEDLLVYLKAVRFDGRGRPILLYLTSQGYASGPKNDPRIWWTAQWTGSRWRLREAIRSDHNYDFGAFYVEPGGGWRLYAPSETGPQPYNTGGEMALWVSEDEGTRWRMERRMTTGSRFNHTYARAPVDASPEFQALWADGHARRFSHSHLYFCDRSGDVYRLPTKIEGDWGRPEPLAGPTGDSSTR